MNAPAETAPAPATNPAYLRVLEALVSLNEPADRERIATKADISPDGAGVQLVALAGKRIVVRCPQPKGAPALWSLAVSLSTARQMVDGMKRAAAEASPAADDRRRIIAAMRELGVRASAFGIAKKSGADLSVVSVMLEAMTADGTVQRIPGSTGQRPKFALAPSVQSQTPAATDGEPGDGTPGEDQDDTQAAQAGQHPGVEDTEEALARRQIDLAHELMALGHRPDSFDDPDDYGDDEIPPAAAYDATVEAEAKADEAPLAGEDVCGADAVIAEWKREHTPAAPTVAPADPFAVWLADTPAGCAGQRAIDAAEREAARLKAEAAEMVREAAEALEFGLIVAEIIRFADQRNASTSTSEAEFGLAELMAAAYEAVTGKRVA